MELEPVMISALAQFSYCPRRCGLMHVESVWEENTFTLRGTELHERADLPVTRTEHGKVIERALPIWSEEYGLVGRADVVEFTPVSVSGPIIVPVEYKSGKPKRKIHASIQLAAQALCLEEMFCCVVPFGALYFFATNERIEIEITSGLREMAMEATDQVRAMMDGGVLPPPVDDDRCPKCSLIDACLPSLVRRAATAQANQLFRPAPEVEGW